MRFRAENTDWGHAATAAKWLLVGAVPGFKENPRADLTTDKVDFQFQPDSQYYYA